MANVKLKHIQSYLQDLATFSEPKAELEQYSTSPLIAAHMLHRIESCYGDIGGKLVADLGCGSAVLAIGASYVGAGLCVGVDLDPDALTVARDNVASCEVDNLEFVQMDVCQQKLSNEHSWYRKFDTVIMNPPFGTQRNSAGVDMQFVQFGLMLSKGAVYSLHKQSTREHVVRAAQRWSAHAEVIAELKFDLPATYRFHKRHSVDIHVDMVRFIHNTPCH